MKTKSLNLIIALMVLGITSVFSQNSKTEKFEVYGNCGMCEKRVEKAATSLDGVTKADWDKDTKMIEVTFDSKQINVDDVHKAIADVGHDTDKVTAKDNTYNDLPGCCRYDRKEKDI